MNTTRFETQIFRGLADSEIRTILDISQETAVSKGEWIFREGDPGDALYVVQKGEIDILKESRDGRPQLLVTLGEGSVIGEMSLLGENGTRSAAARAKTQVKMLSIPTDRFLRLLRDGAPGPLKVIHNLAQVMSKRLLMMDQKLADLLGGGRREELLEFQRILNRWSF